MFQPNGKLALIDFGTAREMTGIYMAKQNIGAITAISSAGFTPPEQEHSRAVPQSDFFALGRTFVYLLTGKMPNDPEIYDDYDNELKWRGLAKGISSQLADLIDELMAAKASQRPDNPGVILQRLQQIKYQLYPQSTPTPKPQPPKPQPQSVPTTVVYQPFWNRRKLIKIAGFAGLGAAGFMVVKNWQFIKGGQLDSFSFEVVKVNDRGNIIKRENHQAKYFTEDLGNDVTLDMVAIPGGTFTMGSPETEEHRESEEGPQHPVTVPAFVIAKYPVTQQQWQTVMGNNPSRFKGGNRPVEMVSWNEAVEFCQKLSEKTGREYRLPSEAEWEYACRAGTTTPFYFGETITTDLANYYGDHTYGNGPKGKNRRETTNVGMFPPNAFGLYDMHGNVYEWCADYWHSNYQGAPTDGSVWISGGNSDYRLLRSGGWGSSPFNCRSAYRNLTRPDGRGNRVGFRVVVS